MRDRASCKCAAAVVGLLAAAGLLTGCNTARVNPSVADTTPPRLTVTSFQLAPELGRAVSQVAQPSVVEYRVVLPTDHPEALISAVATDAESGVVSVQWRGELHAWCMPAWGSTVTPSKVSVAVAGPETVVSPAADGSLPTSASAGFTFVAAAVAAQCHNQVVADYLLELKAFARNGANRQTESIDVRVVRPVDVVVANLFAPCLRELENILGTELSYRVECEGLRIPPGSPPPPISDAPRRVPLNTVLDRWGTFFAQQDMVLLSELHESEARWLHRLQLHAPNHFVAHHGMTVILSRWPLSDIRGALSAPYTFPRWPLFIQSEHVHA
ncbi:MAG: hypothetical protein KIT73_08625, partial [Burkholderiales bacterium]|nr:hypothetical protein [Burkholderiales bacterium]